MSLCFRSFDSNNCLKLYGRKKISGDPHKYEIPHRCIAVLIMPKLVEVGITKFIQTLKQVKTITDESGQVWKPAQFSTLEFSF